MSYYKAKFDVTIFASHFYAIIHIFERVVGVISQAYRTVKYINVSCRLLNTHVSVCPV